jgi:outer membrane lipase/esterase
MRQTNFALALLAAAVLSACGGSDNNNSAVAPKPVFASQVSFGDSLSDLGTYKVGATVTASGGGTFTINGDNTATFPALHGKNWTQLMATQLKFAAPCPAWTGLEGSVAGGFSAPITPNLLCSSYAMGGSRVTNEVGPNHVKTGSPVGALTYPVVKQVAEHLTRNAGKFNGSEIVYVWAGGNDLLSLLGKLTADANAAGVKALITSLAPKLGAGATNPAAATGAIAAAMGAAAVAPNASNASIVGAGVSTAAAQPGNGGVLAIYKPMVDAATLDATAAGNAYAAANGPALVPLMADAGLELTKLIKEQMIAKGATHVVLNSLPDVATTTPTGIAATPSGKQLIAGMVSAFNLALQVGIDGMTDKILYVDLFAASQAQLANPTAFGISNATTPACAPKNSSALFCTINTTLPGVDVSKYLFADDVHPAPYGHSLIAKKVAETMVAKGWL